MDVNTDRRSFDQHLAPLGMLTIGYVSPVDYDAGQNDDREKPFHLNSTVRRSRWIRQLNN